MPRRLIPLLLLMLVGFLLPATHASAHLGEYKFSATSGEWIKTKEYEIEFVRGANPRDDGSSDAYKIGFTFYFDGMPYDQFTVGSNGVIGLGPEPVSSCWVNDLAMPNGDCPGNGEDVYDYTLEKIPHIAPFWDDLRVLGAVTGAVVGKEGSRILVLSFFDIETWYNSGVVSNFQVRLYEGSNKIEFYYENLNPEYDGDGASIGLAAGESNFLSVTPGPKGRASVNTEKPDNFYSPRNEPIPPGTLYIFDPCTMVMRGDLELGNKNELKPGDSLLLNQSVPLYSSVEFSPISIALGCEGEKKFEIYLEGDDYSIDMKGGVATSKEPVIPVITFTPTEMGERLGWLTIVTEDAKYTYYLAAHGSTSLALVGHPDQGGVEDMKDGAVLMENIHVRRRSSDKFSPFTVINTSKNPKSPPVRVTFSIEGISKGQYSIDPAEAEIGAGEELTPTITFSPEFIGTTPEVLTVRAGAQTFTFQLKAYSDAVGGAFTVQSNRLVEGSQVFSNAYGCVDDGPVTLPFEVSNIGNLPFEVQELAIYRTDTSYKQGQPSYPLLRDKANQLIPATDYILSTAPPVYPFRNNAVSLPITLGVGETRTLYLTFIGRETGKRYARAYLRTNDEVITGTDISGRQVEGLLVFDLFGRASGSRMSGDLAGNRLRHVVFPETGVGATSFSTLSVFNTGRCDLRISKEDLRITGGDIEEFAVVSAGSTDSTNNLVIKPGEKADLTFSFSPVRQGSRRATIRLRTNDVNVQYPGIDNRGEFYLNLYGGGGSGLQIAGADFGEALIGGGANEQKHNMASLINTGSTPVSIASMMIDGTDAAEFTEDPDNAWPALPKMLMPGEELPVGIVFAPAANGTPGTRTATLTVSTTDLKTLTAELTGQAGTRTVQVNPTAITFPMTTVGKYQRKMVSISNTGTMTVELEQPEISGPDRDAFTAGKMPRLTLAPGQTELLELTYVAVAPGTLAASLEFAGNMTNGPVSVPINASSKTRNPNDPNVMIPGRQGVIEDGVGMAGGLENLSTSSVGAVSTANGMTLAQSAPNPAQHSVEIRYGLAEAGQVELALYDAQGRLVRVLDAGNRTAGEQITRLDVSTLANGTYIYRLTAGGQTLSRTMQVVR